MDKQQQWHAWYVFVAIMGVILFAQMWALGQNVAVIPYSQFLDDLSGGKIAEVRVSGDYIEGDWKEAQKNGAKSFQTTRVAPRLAAELQSHHVKFSGQVQNTVLATLLSWIVPTALFFALWVFWFRRLAQGQGGLGGLMSIGKSRAKVFVETDTKTTFADVAGADEAKEELQEIVNFLKDPESYGRLGAHVPKGVLLVGPPGTGKTLLARAVAGEAEVPFFSISGSEFVEMFVGVGAARVRDLFHQASERAPAIVFIDELDALGRARGAFPGLGGHDEKEQTLNQLLVELDGFDPTSGIVLLAATNRPEILDPALLRAGRFDRQVLVDRPDRPARRAIVELHLRHIKLAANVDPEQIAELTPGMTGADLANLVNEAALLATRRGAPEVDMNDINEAIERSVAGLARRSRVLGAARARDGGAITNSATRWWRCRCPAPTRCTRSRSSRAASARSATPSSGRPRTATWSPAPSWRTAWRCCWAGARRRCWCSTKSRPGRRTTWSKATDMARAMVARFGMEQTLGPGLLRERSRLRS